MEKQLNESTLHRLTAGQNGAAAREEAAKGRLISQVQAYRNLTDVPQTRDLQVRQQGLCTVVSGFVCCTRTRDGPVCCLSCLLKLREAGAGGHLVGCWDESDVCMHRDVLTGCALLCTV